MRGSHSSKSASAKGLSAQDDAAKREKSKATSSIAGGSPSEGRDANVLFTWHGTLEKKGGLIAGGKAWIRGGCKPEKEKPQKKKKEARLHRAQRKR